MKQTTDLVSETFEEGGLLSKTIPNYKVRPQQVELSKKIKESIEQQKPLIAEAPTGVGKSLASLVPAFEHIQKTDEPVIITTSSIILQEQYINKDIPMLEKLYDFSASPVLIKGRNNYLCPKKLNELRNGKVGFNTSEQIKEADTTMKWAVQTKTGDKAELDFNPTYGVWAKFACVDNNDCNGRQCPFYSNCHYYRERSKVNSAKLIVTNYHYFFNALESVAPMLPPKARVVIMDEGHEISSIARDFQERKYSMNTLRGPFDQFANAIKKAESSEVGNSVFNLFEDLELDRINGTLTDMFVGLGHEYKKVVMRPHYYRDFWMLEIPGRTRLQKYVVEHIKALVNAVRVAEHYLNKYGFSMETIPGTMEIWGEESVEWFVSVFKLSGLLEQKAALLNYMFAFDENEPETEDIFWLQKYQESVSIHAKPTSGAGLTGPLFEKTENGFIPIVMSATLAANQSFDHLKEDLGIEQGVNELIVSSPFKLEENLLWYLPPDTPAGNEQGHLDFVLRNMKKVIEQLDGKTLCLFTSIKNLRTAENYLSGVLPKHIQVISQDNLPKQKIIDMMKANPHTVLLGTKSFFTGIDIQGQNLSAVLIDKFPFPMIGDPVNDFLMDQPRGFHKFSLPEAIIAMKQGFGRLNRTTTDKGVVAIFDGRLATAKYKNKIFNSFDFKIRATKNWDDVVEYINNI